MTVNINKFSRVIDVDDTNSVSVNLILKINIGRHDLSAHKPTNYQTAKH